ncbi:hypothetical protein [Selenihalanaerobacter shriftii]|uniref:Uncharacterized protein n=1 Tax=Selenihalanaerobacter shriftii TaxID=142842 RepID=A0A1T4K7E3_9FIRM|nr:hypothetical protein [Selenihalanaerobacter shriftii]SJZ38342.1 hypothetical protein SAMN02745118_00664 [Selenihalanaerobacter shriftii]
MGIKCYHCGSMNTHFKEDILSDCCQKKKEGEKWFCKDCKSIFSFFVVYSDDEEPCCHKKSN